MKNALKKVAIISMFIAAIDTTFYHITGVQAVTYMYEEASGYDGDHTGWEDGKRLLSFQSIFHNRTVVSSANAMEAPQKLEETIDFAQYPVKTVEATGYTAGIESTGKKPGNPSYGITYSGVKVKRDLYSTIAADLTVFPLGTILFIPDYGYGVVADTGSAIKGDKLDLYYDTVNDVFNYWGKKSLQVYIVKQGDGTLSEAALTKLNENEAVQVFRQQFTGITAK